MNDQAKTKEKKSIKEYIKTFWTIFLFCVTASWKSSKKYTLIRFFSQIILSGVGIATAYFGKMIINLLSNNTNQSSDKLSLIYYLVTVLLINIFAIFLRKTREYCSSVHNDKMTSSINLEIAKKAAKADLELFDCPEFYNNLEMARRSVQSIIISAWNALDLVNALVSLITTLMIVGFISPILTFILFLTTIPSTIVNQIYTKKLYWWSKEHVNEERQMGYFTNILTSRNFAQDIRLFNIGDRLLHKYLNIWIDLFVKRNKMNRKRTILTILISFLPEICTTVIIINISMAILNGQKTVGDYSLYASLISQLLGSMYLLFNSIIRMYDDRLRIDSYMKFMGTENRIVNSGTYSVSEISSIKFDHVCFHYPGSEKLVLDNVSFTIYGKQKVCLVGVNGAGKTTLIKLILRFYDVDSGTIFINGKDIREYELTNLRRMFSCYFQSFNNYAFTIRENVTISDIEKPMFEQEIISALKNSDSYEIVEKAPNGLDSYLTKIFEDNGIELSGGQNQKIALARAFYRDSSVILLDEPSASLDPEAEHRVFENLEVLCKNKMTLFTSHRLANTAMADLIIVIECGRIIEIGSHEELMQKQNRYATLFTYQAEKYVR